jgi:NTE family protein
MRGLVLSGGGTKGAYQAGAVSHLLGELKLDYDVFCGVSVGALNSALLAQYPAGDCVRASQAILGTWAKIDSSKIYKKWTPFGDVMAFFKPSLYDSAPLQALVRAQLDRSKVLASGKKLRLGAVSLASGEYREFREDYPDLAGAVLASSAFPAMLCPILLDGELWTDGGVREITPLKAAIDLGADRIDVVLCSPEKNAMAFPPNTNALKVAERCIDLMSDEIIARDIEIAQHVNTLVANGLGGGKRTVQIRILRPDHVLIDNSLDFDPPKILKMISQGFEGARVAFPESTS